jgi:hypothetical protein
MSSTVYALLAIALWTTLASLGTALSHLPPFLLTGLALIIGSVPSWPLVLRDRRAWKVPPRTLALGVYGLFGYHFLLFIALRYAPPVEANLVNYLWPLLMVVLAPVLLPGVTLRPLHLVAGLLGFAGAAAAILGAGGGTGGAHLHALLGLPAGAGLGLRLGQLLAGHEARRGLPDLGHRPVRAGLGRAVAHLPRVARTLGGAVGARLAAAGAVRPGPAGRRLFRVGHGAQARRRAPDRHPELPHAAGLDRAAAARDRPAADLDHRAGGRAHHLGGRDGHPRGARLSD